MIFTMNILDIIICIPLLWGVYKGFTKGVIYEIFLLMALAVGVWGGFKFAYLASEYLQKTFSINASWLPLLSFLTVFVIIVVLIILLAKFLEGMIKITGLSIVNKVLGAIFGMLKWALIVSIIFYLLNPVNDKMNFISKEKEEKSFLYGYITKLGTLVTPELQKIRETPPNLPKGGGIK